MPTMITMQCAHCGKVFQRELHRMNHAKKFYCSKVGAVYDALKFEARYGGHGGYVIESGGKKINVRLDEAVEI